MDGTHPDLTGFLGDTFGCAPEVADAIARRAIVQAYATGAAILRQSEESRQTFLLILGRAHALVYGRDGQLVLLAELGPGDLFGGVVEPGDQLVEADVVCVEPARAAAFLTLDFLAIVEAHACLGLAVSRMLLRQLRAATGKIVERVTLSAQGRVFAELLRLARLGDGKTLRPAPVLSALAVRVHTTRETASRAVGMLERRGLVRRDGDALILVAPHRLEELVV